MDKSDFSSNIKSTTKPCKDAKEGIECLPYFVRQPNNSCVSHAHVGNNGWVKSHLVLINFSRLHSRYPCNGFNRLDTLVD